MTYEIPFYIAGLSVSAGAAETVAARVAETGFCQYFGRKGRNTKYDIFKICSLLMNAIDCCLQSHTCSQCIVITRPVN